MDYKLIIASLYGIVQILGLIAYLPTLKDLYINKKKSANLNSYLLWFIGSFITLIYAYFVVGDMLFSLSALGFSILNLLVVIGIILLNKQFYKGN